ncbi:MAG TPA: DUF4912 domain-containing protein [Leptospiraceae bacterium]|nr:DUF4912 domain-containing protein [Leptospiraceae bacterium]HNF23540.1 DUF4912 domain-containing protein [Leptospiraceae bacterium]HNI24997.1 DUF4912 domain-containing protein [Leptospiraceae bacterium]HNN04099.1 DUF4912 domain-containing protein [Leptospiraceae bacterium]HNO23168.1 DUF4912 domain-containing protein [Leptospiraceae bacterium]
MSDFIANFRKFDSMKETTTENSGIYLEEAMNRIPEYYDRDIIKILLKNPKEAFVFWGISLDSYKKIEDYFGKSRNEIRYKLFVRYLDESKTPHFQEILLAPYAQSYVIKFLGPVKNLRAEISAYVEQEGEYTMMHSAAIHLPRNRPSHLFHKDWLDPRFKAYFTAVSPDLYTDIAGLAIPGAAEKLGTLDFSKLAEKTEAVVQTSVTKYYNVNSESRPYNINSEFMNGGNS